jgi:hypothetical protein
MARNGQVQISWQALALIGGTVIAIVTGAIQLGAVQTHVVINTARLDKLEDNEHRFAEDLASLKAQRSEIIGRLDAIVDRLKSLERPRP